MPVQPFLFEMPPLLTGHVVSDSVEIFQHALDFRNVNTIKSQDGLSRVNNGENFTVVLRPVFFPRPSNPVTNPTISSFPADFASGDLIVRFEFLDGSPPIIQRGLSFEKKYRKTGRFLGWGVTITAQGDYITIVQIRITDTLGRTFLSGNPLWWEDPTVMTNANRQIMIANSDYTYVQALETKREKVFSSLRIDHRWLTQSASPKVLVLLNSSGRLIQSLVSGGFGITGTYTVITIQGNTYNRIIAGLDPKVFIINAQPQSIRVNERYVMVEDMKLFTDTVNGFLQDKNVNDAELANSGLFDVGAAGHITGFRLGDFYTQWSPNNPLIFNCGAWRLDAWTQPGTGTDATLIDYTTTCSIYPTVFAFKVV